MARFKPVSFPMMSTIRRISLVILISGAIGMLLFAYLYFSETSFFPHFRHNAADFLTSAMIGAVTGVCLYYANLVLDRWLPWRRLYAARFVVGYISNFLIAGVISFGLSAAISALSTDRFFWVIFSTEDEDMKLKLGILLLTSIFVYKVTYALLYSYQQYAVAQLEHLQRKRKQLELQFDALKSQISPHYLFNSLNTISSLIYKDTPSAEQFVRRLAQTYQYILSTQNRHHVTLKDEIDFVQSYYYLLRIRFQQQLNVEINLPSSIMNSKIPPLTLQILVENAVKHNAISSDKKLFIYITAQDNTHLKVINTKNENHDTIQSFRVGLDNIRKRYAFFTDKKIDVRDDEKFTVTLPVIHHDREHEQRHSA